MIPALGSGARRRHRPGRSGRRRVDHRRSGPGVRGGHEARPRPSRPRCWWWGSPRWQRARSPGPGGPELASNRTGRGCRHSGSLGRRGRGPAAGPEHPDAGLRRDHGGRGIRMLREAATKPKGPAARAGAGPSGPAPRRPWGWACSSGFLTGLLGVGGGFLITPALTIFLGLRMKQAVGTSLAIIVINSAAGFSGPTRRLHHRLGHHPGVTAAAIVASSSAPDSPAASRRPPCGRPSAGSSWPWEPSSSSSRPLPTCAGSSPPGRSPDSSTAGICWYSSLLPAA